MRGSDLRRPLTQDLSLEVVKRKAVPTWRMAGMSHKEICRELGRVILPMPHDAVELDYPQMSTVLLLNLGITHVNPLRCHLHRWMLAKVQARDGMKCYRCRRNEGGGLALLKICRATLLGLDLGPVRAMCPECRAITNFEREKKALSTENPPEVPAREVEEVEEPAGREQQIAPGQQRDERGRLVSMAAPRKVSLRKWRRNGPRRKS